MFVGRAVAGRFVRHCEEHHLLPAKQSAYRRFHSTETTVLVVYTDIVCAVDSGQLVPLVLLYLSSAFDTVDHDCLLTILYATGSPLRVGQWTGFSHTYRSGLRRLRPPTATPTP